MTNPLDWMRKEIGGLVDAWRVDRVNADRLNQYRTKCYDAEYSMIVAGKTNDPGPAPVTAIVDTDQDGWTFVVDSPVLLCPRWEPNGYWAAEFAKVRDAYERGDI